MSAITSQDDFYKCIQQIQLKEPQKTILTTRYLQVILGYESRVFLYSIAFHSLRTSVTVGSLIVPALLSVEFMDSTPSEFKIALYWITWCLSLLVTISNGIYTLYKIDKKYYMLHTVYQQLRSEGWQYLMLTGRYNVANATHLSQFPSFCLMVEKIRMRQIEDEYYKVNEHHPTVASASIVPSSTTSKFDVSLLKELLASKKGSLFDDIPQQTQENTRQQEEEIPATKDNSASSNAPTEATFLPTSGQHELPTAPENIYVSIGSSTQSNPFFSESNNFHAPK